MKPRRSLAGTAAAAFRHSRWLPTTCIRDMRLPLSLASEPRLSLGILVMRWGGGFGKPDLWVKPQGFGPLFLVRGFSCVMVSGVRGSQLCPTTPKLALLRGVLLHLPSPRAKPGFACPMVNCSHLADAPTGNLY